MKKIVVLGGGYGGVLTAKKLAKNFKKNTDVQIQLIDRNPYHTLLTELHEVAANRTPEDAVKIDLKKIFAGLKVDVILDEIENIDFTERSLKGKQAAYAYDYLVIGTGSKPTFFGIPGAQENSYTLWSYDDAVRLKDRFRQMFTEAAKESDLAVRREKLSFVVVGAGFTGVELIGEMAEYRSELCREFYIDPSEVRMIVADMAPKILPLLPDKLIAKSERYLKKLDIEIITGKQITGVSETGVELGDQKLTARTVIWTAGVEGAEILDKLDVQQKGRKRIETNDKLQSLDHENVYVVGDNIFFIPEGEERPVPQMVENAEHAAPLIAHNITADIKGGTKKSYKPAFHGMMVSIGSRYGVASVGLPGKFFSLTGFFAMFAKHAINVLYLFTVLGFNKVWTYLMHEIFHAHDRRTFLGGHFSKRSPNFWLVPLRVFVGWMWLHEGWDKLQKVIDDPNNIFLIPPDPNADVVSAASEAVGNVASTVDAQTAASAVENAGQAVQAIPVPGFVSDMVSSMMDLMFYSGDGGYTWLATAFQVGMVAAEIIFGLMLIAGLFSAIASIATIGMGLMIWSSGMAPTDMWWYWFSAFALIGGSGSIFGLDYYVLPWLKKHWKKTWFAKRWYLYTD
ncbi:FAD-dependent oxidoreductase [Saccharibacillus deserti]|uniref:FAD-dependent oxidoreductase n=1 Tax=Saccharibacillus deserti TaxID=1634444 RepID=UPI0015572661|nr:FAD-dependent oxidoreductase [Saccharibacillus deserti]